MTAHALTLWRYLTKPNSYFYCIRIKIIVHYSLEPCSHHTSGWFDFNLSFTDASISKSHHVPVMGRMQFWDSVLTTMYASNLNINLSYFKISKKSKLRMALLRQPEIHHGDFSKSFAHDCKRIAFIGDIWTLIVLSLMYIE